MITMIDLLRHLMYINKREEVEPMWENQAVRVLLMAMAVCYKHGYDIHYDRMIEKSSWGAKSVNLVPKKWRGYSRGYPLRLEEGKSLSALEQNKELDESLSALIINNSKNYRSIPEAIMSTSKADRVWAREVDDFFGSLETGKGWVKRFSLND